jgi:hypothetical protein
VVNRWAASAPGWHDDLFTKVKFDVEAIRRAADAGCNVQAVIRTAIATDDVYAVSANARQWSTVNAQLAS